MINIHVTPNTQTDYTRCSQVNVDALAKKIDSTVKEGLFGAPIVEDIQGDELLAVKTASGEYGTIPVSRIGTGGNSQTKSIKITYQELKTLRDNSELIPGQTYQITDYETITTEYETKTANHYFDVVVTAESENTLAQQAYAAHSERDTDGYFADSDLSKWILDYSLDNDMDEFEWAPSDDGYAKRVYIYGEDFDYPCLLDRDSYSDTSVDDKMLYAFYASPYSTCYYSDSEDVTNESVVYSYAGEALENLSFIVHEGNFNPGKGIIYRMIDEFGNDLPYDFKNILIVNEYTMSGSLGLRNTNPTSADDLSASVNRSSTFDRTLDGVYLYGWYGTAITMVGSFPQMTPFTCYTTTLNINADTPIYLSNYPTPSQWVISSAPTRTPVYRYTFGNTTDASLKDCYNNKVVANEKSLHHACFFGEQCTNNYLERCLGTVLLGNNTNINLIAAYKLNIPYDMYNFSMGPNSSFSIVTVASRLKIHDITIGEYCTNISLGSENSNIIIGNNCDNIKISNFCTDIIVGDYCTNNTFEQYCTNNVLGNNCNNNNFKCTSYTQFGNPKYSAASGNTLGEYCNDNTFMGGCSYNDLGDNCEGNVFQSTVVSSSVGMTPIYSVSTASGIDVGSYGSNNTFAEGCSSVTCNGGSNSIDGSSIRCNGDGNELKGGNININGDYNFIDGNSIYISEGSNNSITGANISLGLDSNSNTITGENLSFGSNVNSVFIDRCYNISAEYSIRNVTLFDVYDTTLGHNINDLIIGTSLGELSLRNSSVGNNCSYLNMQLDPTSAGKCVFGIHVSDNVIGSSVGGSIYLYGYTNNDQPSPNTPSYTVAVNSNREIVIYCSADVQDGGIEIVNDVEDLPDDAPNGAIASVVKETKTYESEEILCDIQNLKVMSDYDDSYENGYTKISKLEISPRSHSIDLSEYYNMYIVLNQPSGNYFELSITDNNIRVYSQDTETIIYDFETEEINQDVINQIKESINSGDYYFVWCGSYDSEDGYSPSYTNEMFDLLNQVFQLYTIHTTETVVDADAEVYIKEMEWKPLLESSSSGNTGSVGMLNVTYAELKNLRDTSALIPGQMYRITDYETTTIQSNTRSAGNMFDVIVKASSTNKLASEAQATQSSRDTEGYFANCDLSAWKLWYCLDNDSTLYPWIDTENGKGVIYRMIDERNNDVPYDFKNVQFKRFGITEYTKNPNIKINDAGLYLGLLDEEGSVIPNNATLSEDFLWVYTFTLVNMVDSSYLDATISPITEYGESCSNNIIQTAYAFLNNTAYAYLNNIVLLNAYVEEEGSPMYAYSYNNKFGTDCANSSFGVNTCNNSFDYWCKDNIVANGFNDNKLGYMSSGNTFGNMVYANTFGHEFRSNNTGNSVYHNTFGDRCWINDICSDFSCNIIEHEFMSNKFQDGSKNPSSHYKYNYFGPNIGNCIFVNDEEASDNNQVQHYRVAAGMDLKSVTLSRNLAQETTVAMNTAGEVKIFNLADLVS